MYVSVCKTLGYSTNWCGQRKAEGQWMEMRRMRMAMQSGQLETNRKRMRVDKPWTMDHRPWMMGILDLMDSWFHGLWIHGLWIHGPNSWIQDALSNRRPTKDDQQLQQLQHQVQCPLPKRFQTLNTTVHGVPQCSGPWSRSMDLLDSTMGETKKLEPSRWEFNEVS